MAKFLLMPPEVFIGASIEIAPTVARQQIRWNHLSLRYLLIGHSQECIIGN